MDYGKYIIIENQGLEIAFLFDNLISHDFFLHNFHKDSIIAAGFFEVGSNPTVNNPRDITITVFGKSTTINKEARKGQDERLIKRILQKEDTF